MPGGSYGESNSRPGYYDPYGSPQDLSGNRQQDYSVHGYSPTRRDHGSYSGAGQYGDKDYIRPENNPRREYRSRTPGPEFMRGSSGDDMYLHARTQEARSKTPTHELQYHQHHPHQTQPPHNISGTPDFIPASRYQTPSSPANQQGASHGPSSGGSGDAVPYRHNHEHPDRRQRPISGPEVMHTYNSGSPVNQPYSSPGGSNRINVSQTYAGNLNYAAGQSQNYQNVGHNYPDRGVAISPTGDRPRKQSTSFENEEPVPSNLTRLPKNDRWAAADSPQSSLNRSRSPTRFGEDDRYMDMNVFLQRQESGFGFRIIGGTEEGSQVSSILCNLQFSDLTNLLLYFIKGYY